MMNTIDIVLGLVVAGIFGIAFRKGFMNKGKCGGCSCGCSREAAKVCHASTSVREE